MGDPFPGYEVDDLDPFAAFAMSEFHSPDVAQKVLYEEQHAISFQVACSEPHGAGGVLGHEVEMTPVHDGPCPGCGAVV